MAQVFKVNQYPGYRLQFQIDFNARVPNTVTIYRDGQLFDEVTSFHNSKLIDTEINNSVTMRYEVECSTRRGLAEVKRIDSAVDQVTYGFDDIEGSDGDFDDATITVYFSTQ